MRIFHIPNDCFWFGAAYELRLMTYSHETAGYYHHRRFVWPASSLVIDLGVPFNYSGRGTYSQATPGLLNAWNSEIRSSTIHCSFLHLRGVEDQFSATEAAVVHLDTFWIPAT